MSSKVNDIIDFYQSNKKWLLPILISLGMIILSIIVSITLTKSFFFVFFRVLGISIIGFALFKLVNFYKGPERQNHEFNRFYASHFISSFYKILFPVFIVGIIAQVLLQISLLPPEFGGLGLLDYQSISPSFMITFTVVSFITGLGVMALSDYEMKKNNLMYSDKVGKTSFLRSMGYVLPLAGFYMGLIFFVKFFLEQSYGIGVLIPQRAASFEIESYVSRSARFWDLSTDNEKIFIFITFFVAYIALEFLLRGLMARQAEGYGLGPAGMVFTPAILQAVAFTSGIVVFSEPIYYMFEIFDAFLLGIVLGLILWRTGNFASTIFAALFIRLFDSRLEFQSVILKLLPRPFGEYNPLDNVTTLADTIGNYLVYFQIALVAITPFIIIVSYEEVGSILKSLYAGLKKQWFGYLALAIAFFLIDLVFSYVTNFLGAILGFILALLIIRFVLTYFLQVLPAPNQPPVLASKKDRFDGEIPLSVSSDIKYLEKSTSWYSRPLRNGILGAFAFIYFLFLAAAYRQYESFTLIESLTFTTFLVILPATIIGTSFYLISRAENKGFFFSENWRSSLMNFSIVMFVVNVLIWTNRSSIVDFSWRLVPFALFFVLLIWPKPLRTPTRDLALGFARDSRYATFRWVEENKEVFEDHFDELRELPSDNIQLGCYIMAAKLGLLDPKELVNDLRNRDGFERGQILGRIFALGLMKYREAEGLLLDLLKLENIDYKMACYWSLGHIGSSRSLRRMAKILEENPKKDLIPIAEKAILSIDPNYPLAGIRDSISLN